ncbi:MAG TPA: hypothetical protein EYO58_10190 [Flavobacteriales bacterium]|nr:hypothetical protein [Flavobacteriales bacterium]
MSRLAHITGNMEGERSHTLEIYEKALELYPDDPCLGFNYAVTLSEEPSGHEKAKDVYRQLLAGADAGDRFIMCNLIQLLAPRLSHCQLLAKLGLDETVGDEHEAAILARYIKEHEPAFVGSEDDDG